MGSGEIEGEAIQRVEVESTQGREQGTNVKHRGKKQQRGGRGVANLGERESNTSAGGCRVAHRQESACVEGGARKGER